MSKTNEEFETILGSKEDVSQQQKKIMSRIYDLLNEEGKEEFEKIVSTEE